MKLNCRPLTLNLFKPFLKTKNRSGKTLCIIFYKILKTKKNSVIFYYLTPELKFPPKRFEWSKSLLLRFKPPHKNSSPSKISHLPNGQISQGFPQVFRTWEDLNRYIGGLGVGGGG